MYRYIYKHILEITSEGFWAIEANDYKITEVNDALCRMLGYGVDEILGKTPFDFADEENKKKFQVQILKIPFTKYRKYEIELTKKDGSKLHTIFNATTIFDDNGSVMCAIAMITDISSKVRIQNELNETNDRLHKSEALIRTILDSQHNLVVVTDGKKVIDANSAFLNFFNLNSLGDIADKECFCVFMRLEPPFNCDSDGCYNWLREIERLGWRVDMRDKNFGLLKNFIVISSPYSGDNTLYVVTFTDITKLQNEMDYFIYLASTDTLTGLNNRAKFYETIDSSIAKSRRYDSSTFCVIMFDVDYFKQVNDSFGHHQGDLVLQKLAKIIQNNIRSSDFIARYGGEEFIILAPQINVNQAMIFAEKLRLIIETTQMDGIFITCSFGVCEYGGEKDRALLVDKADKLLYKAKRLGRNCVVSEIDPS